MKSLLVLLFVSCVFAKSKWVESEWEDDLAESIPGEPGVDYPILSSVPQTAFTCNDKLPGYYGDTQTGCQVFHVCHYESRQDSFLCPNGSVFDQTTFACEWWFNVNCDVTPRYYELNKNLFKGPDVSLYGKISPALYDFMIDSLGIELPGSQNRLNVAPPSIRAKPENSEELGLWSDDRPSLPRFNSPSNRKRPGNSEEPDLWSDDRPSSPRFNSPSIRKRPENSEESGLWSDNRPSFPRLNSSQESSEEPRQQIQNRPPPQSYRNPKAFRFGPAPQNRIPEVYNSGPASQSQIPEVFNSGLSLQSQIPEGFNSNPAPKNQIPDVFSSGLMSSSFGRIPDMFSSGPSSSSFGSISDMFNSGPKFSNEVQDKEPEIVTKAPETTTVRSSEVPDSEKSSQGPSSFEKEIDNLITKANDAVDTNLSNQLSEEGPPPPPSRRQVPARHSPRQQQPLAIPPRSPNPAVFQNLVAARPKATPHKVQQATQVIVINPQSHQQALRIAKQIQLAQPIRNLPQQTQHRRPATTALSAPVQRQLQSAPVQRPIQSTPLRQTLSAPVRPPPQPASRAKAPQGVISLKKFAQARTAAASSGFSQPQFLSGGWKPVGSVAKRALRQEDFLF